MSNAARIAWRILLAPVLAYAAFVGYGYCVELFGNLIPASGAGKFTYAALLAQGFLAAAIPSLFLGYPIARLYGRLTVPIAVALAAPAVALRVLGLVGTSRHPYSIVISTYEIVCYAVLLIGTAWLARRHLVERSNNRLERQRRE